MTHDVCWQMAVSTHLGVKSFHIQSIFVVFCCVQIHSIISLVKETNIILLKVSWFVTIVNMMLDPQHCETNEMLWECRIMLLMLDISTFD